MQLTCRALCQTSWYI